MQPRWRDPKVARDNYAQVLGALYSLPTKYIGQKLRKRLGVDLLIIDGFGLDAMDTTESRNGTKGR